MDELLKASPLSVAMLVIVLLVGLLTFLIKRRNGRASHEPILEPLEVMGPLQKQIDERIGHKINNALTVPTMKIGDIEKAQTDHEARLRALEQRSRLWK